MKVWTLSYASSNGHVSVFTTKELAKAEAEERRKTWAGVTVHYPILSSLRGT